MMQLPKHILLFGHRKQHGKDTCCDILENYFSNNNIKSYRTYFAKSLKEKCADKYILDIPSMESDDYKNSRPEHLNGKSVRDVLIEFGLAERAKDPLVFCRPVYTDMYKSGADFCLVSDFRFPNEGNSGVFILEELMFKKRTKKAERQSFMNMMPQVHKILIHRPEGRFVNDGADDQLPDIDNYWTHVIINEDTNDWKEKLTEKILSYISQLVEK
jgi:hypothetical protein